MPIVSDPTTTTVTASWSSVMSSGCTRVPMPRRMIPSTLTPVPSHQANIVRLRTEGTQRRGGMPLLSTRLATGRRDRSDSR